MLSNEEKRQAGSTTGRAAEWGRVPQTGLAGRQKVTLGTALQGVRKEWGGLRGEQGGGAAGGHGVRETKRGRAQPGQGPDCSAFQVSVRTWLFTLRKLQQQSWSSAAHCADEKAKLHRGLKMSQSSSGEQWSPDSEPNLPPKAVLSPSRPPND